MEEGMMNSLTGNSDNSLESELELMLRQRHSRAVSGRERDLNMYRSGSAPPTVEGSLSAVGSLFANSNFVPFDNSNGVGMSGVMTEEELRSHPAYIAYYYSHGNFNPRLPPPVLSREDWRIAQRFRAGGSSFEGTRDWWKKDVIEDSSSSSLFSMQPGLHKSAEAELMELRKAAAAKTISRKSSAEWMDRADGLIGVSPAGMGGRKKSFADILQEGLEQPASSIGRISRSASRNAICDVLDLCNGKELSETLGPRVSSPDLSRLQSLNSAVSHSFASAVGSSLPRSRTPENQPIRRTPSPSIPPGIPPMASRVLPVEKRNLVGMHTLNDLSMSELADVAASLSTLSLQKSQLPDKDSNLQSRIQMELGKQSNYLLDMSNGQRRSLQQQFVGNSRKDNMGIDINVQKSGFDGPVNLHRRAASSVDCNSNLSMYEFMNSESNKIHNQPDKFSRADFSNQMPTRSSAQTLKSAVNNHPPTVSTSKSVANGHIPRQKTNQAESSLHMPVMDSQFNQYMVKSSDYGTHSAAGSGDVLRGRNSYGTSLGHGDLQGLQNVYIKALLAQQNQQYDSALFGRSGSLNHLAYGNPTFGHGIPYQGLENSVVSSAGSRPLSQHERSMLFTSTLRNSTGGSAGSWNPEIGINLDGRYVSSLLDELKSNKTKSFELSDVVGHVIEFSTDQYGSRFIQQKLETATVEEKKMIFPEIIPHARSLMTDVFGNYVIQKFFEYGTEDQRKELACQLIGHVLPLSLQMYGCRVIQKALEVVDVDLQTQMVKELDGSVMKCVRDQNGNHVIQKCIECVSQDRIQFVVSSFFGQVVSLSSHPYGCRVIQRVLEHCDDANTQQIVMNEIMNAVCSLAQDQYGNYVIQHVLQHGKPHERSAVISKLAGQIVKMSQQKFASNVVEKCLTFGGPEERQLLVNEMLGSTDENEPLQAMMKDPFGNYVVQKVLETCDDRNRELILSRIKVHLAALKRYTYGKHIVTRVEKLIASGERHSAMSASSSS